MGLFEQLKSFFSARSQRLRIQWHVTDRCNLACTHCYGEQFDFQPDYADLVQIWKRIKNFARSRERQLRNPIHTHIILTGGEPLLRNDFFRLLKMIHSAGRRFEPAILTNGTLIDRPLAQKLAKFNPSFVQVSLEGPARIHDHIRGTGSYDLAITGIRHLVAAGIRVLISFTANQNNFHYFKDVAATGCELGVHRVWADRQVPLGKGRGFETLSYEQTKSLFQIMYQAAGKAGTKNDSTEIAMHRSLQFLVSGGQPYACSAGRSLLTILADGSLVPCRRMPVILGNIHHTSISRIYHTSPLLQRLRDPDLVPSGCESCAHLTRCRGGARCLSFAALKDPFTADPGCWPAKERSL